jgi:hypothetical protein
MGTVHGQELVAQNIEVGFGGSFSFDLPPNTVDWRIEGKFFSGQPILCKKGDCGQFFQPPTITNVGDGKTRLTLVLLDLFSQGH